MRDSRQARVLGDAEITDVDPSETSDDGERDDAVAITFDSYDDLIAVASSGDAAALAELALAEVAADLGGDGPWWIIDIATEGLVNAHWNTDDTFIATTAGTRQFCSTVDVNAPTARGPSVLSRCRSKPTRSSSHSPEQQRLVHR